jgi:hypothetical protein
LTEWRSINLHNGILHQGLGANQLVVAGVVDDIDDTRLAGDSLASPRKVASVKTERAMLKVTTAGAHDMDTLGSSKLGVGRLATKFELALLAVVGALGSRCRSLVATVTTNAYMVLDTVMGKGVGGGEGWMNGDGMATYP